MSTKERKSKKQQKQQENVHVAPFKVASLLDPDASWEKGHGSLERDDEDVYFDDESAEVVISSLRLGDDQEGGSLFTNSNWFAFEDDRIVNERSSDVVASELPNVESTNIVDKTEGDDPIVEEDKDAGDLATPPVRDGKTGRIWQDPIRPDPK